MVKMIKVNGATKWVGFAIAFLAMFGGALTSYITLNNTVESNRVIAELNHQHMQEDIQELKADVKEILATIKETGR